MDLVTLPWSTIQVTEVRDAVGCMCVSEGCSTNVCNPAAQLLPPTKVVVFFFYSCNYLHLLPNLLYLIFKLNHSLKSVCLGAVERQYPVLKDQEDVYPAHLSWRFLKVKSNHPVKWKPIMERISNQNLNILMTLANSNEKRVYFTLGGTLHPSASVCAEHKLFPGLSVNCRWLFSPVIIRAVFYVWSERITHLLQALFVSNCQAKNLRNRRMAAKGLLLPSVLKCGFSGYFQFLCGCSQENTFVLYSEELGRF